MPTHFVQKAPTGSLIGITDGDPQPGNVASVGVDSTLHAFVFNDNGTRRVLSEQESVRVNINASSVTGPVFVADKAYQVVSVTEVHSVVSTSGTLIVEKDTGTTAPGSGTSLFVSTNSRDLTSTINTPVSQPLNATVATLKLAAGDRLAFKFGGDLTGLVGTVTVVIKPI